MSAVRKEVVRLSHTTVEFKGVKVDVQYSTHGADYKETEDMPAESRYVDLETASIGGEDVMSLVEAADWVGDICELIEAQELRA